MTRTAVAAMSMLMCVVVAGCGQSARVAASAGTAGQSAGCTLIVPRSVPPGAIGPGPDPALSVPFRDVDGPFTRGLSKPTTVVVSPTRPATFGVTLGHDAGMAVDLVQFVAKPATYRGGDSGLEGAAWDYSRRNLRANSQTILVTFRGLDDAGRPLSPGLYKVMVELYGHRTSMSTCKRHGSGPPGYRDPTDTGIIYGLARIDRGH